MFQQNNWPLVVALTLISLPIAAEEIMNSEATVNGQKSAGKADKIVDTVAAGLQVFIDEQTGEIRSPTKAETAAIAEQFQRRYFDLSVDKPVVQHADGSISKELGAQNRLYSVARLSDDGELETVCLPANQAAEFLTNKNDLTPVVEDANK